MIIQRHISRTSQNFLGIYLSPDVCMYDVRIHSLGKLAYNFWRYLIFLAGLNPIQQCSSLPVPTFSLYINIFLICFPVYWYWYWLCFSLQNSRHRSSRPSLVVLAFLWWKCTPTSHGSTQLCAVAFQSITGPFSCAPSLKHRHCLVGLFVLVTQIEHARRTAPLCRYLC